MRHTIYMGVAVVLLGAVLTGPAAATHDESHQARLEERYLAGSAHVHAAGSHQAVGPVDCSGQSAAVGPNAGGACFDLSDFDAGADLFLRADDDNSPTEVSLFAGFDIDGDGCVGCVPGQDRAWTGTGSLAADLVDPDEPLVVFVRAASVEDGAAHAATTGSLTLDVLDDGNVACEDGSGAGDECGEPFKSELPYPYPCLPDCGS